MTQACSLFVVAGLLACLTGPLAGQRPTAKPRPHLKALRSLQSALQSLQNAQIDLLQAGDRQAERAVAKAIADLSRTRKKLLASIRKSPQQGRAAMPKNDAATARAIAKNARKYKPLPPGTIDKAVERGLNWLTKHQDANGKWDADGFMKHAPKKSGMTGAGSAVHDVGVTSLALLAFMRGGNTTKQGVYKNVVRNGYQWLKKQQDPKNGLFGTNASHDFIYNHAIATFAACRLAGLTQDREIHQAAARGIQYLAKHRNPYAVWRYQPRDNDNDVSVTTWCVLAYSEARKLKIATDKNALVIAKAYYDQVIDPGSGRTGYTKRGEASSRHPGRHSVRFPPKLGEAMTAAGLTARFALGQQPKAQPIMTKSATRLAEKLPSRDKSAADHYYWFFGTQAMRKMGGDFWAAWSPAITATIIDSQRREGFASGSWDPKGVWGRDGGRIYSTSLMLMALMTAKP